MKLAPGLLCLLLLVTSGCATSPKVAASASSPCFAESTSCERSCYDAARTQLEACKTIGCREYVLRDTTLDACVAKCGASFETCHAGSAR
jgi:hypothetical protein